MIGLMRRRSWLMAFAIVALAACAPREAGRTELRFWLMGREAEVIAQLLPDFEQRFPAGAPSLRRCRRFEVEGDVTFGAGVVAVGDVRVVGPGHVRDGGVLGG